MLATGFATDFYSSDAEKEEAAKAAAAAQPAAALGKKPASQRYELYPSYLAVVKQDSIVIAYCTCNV